MSYKSILCISDLHIPYHHPQAFDFLKALKKKIKPDLIVNGGMTNEKQIKDAVITAYQTNEFQKTGFRTDFSYDPDPYPIMPTTSGGIDTSKMSTMGKFFAESLGISKQASNKNIASPVKKEQIDNLLGGIRRVIKKL